MWKNLEIYQNCQISRLLCGRFIFSGAYSFIGLTLSTYSLYKTYKVYHKMTQELGPMTFCSLMALLNFIAYVFVYMNQLIIIIDYFQIIIFAFIAQSFVNVYYRIQMKDESIFAIFYDKMLIFVCIAYLSLFALMIYSIVKTEQFKCNDYFYLALYLILGQLVTIGFISFVYAYKILRLFEQLSKQIGMNFRKMPSAVSRSPPKKSQKPNKLIPLDAYASLTKKEFRLSLRDSLITREPAFIAERRKQIKFANLSLGIQILLYCLFIPAVHSNLNTIVCNFKQVKENDIPIWQNIILMIFTLVQLSPCILLPYTFYFVAEVERLDAEQKFINFYYLSEEGEPGADDVLFYSKSFKNPSFLNVTNEDLFLKNLLSQQKN